MLALALLDRIVSVDKQQQWLLYLSNSGYLKVLVDSLVEDDRTLQSLLTPQPPLLKALYTYESKMVRVVDTGIRSAAVFRAWRCVLEGCCAFHWATAAPRVYLLYKLLLF